MSQGKHSHILNASSNLLGICFVIITGLKLTGMSAKTWADEFSAFAAINLLGASVLSYLSMRGNDKRALQYENWADYMFLIALFALFFAVAIFYMDIL